jgi:hypothetical protein
MLPSTVLVASSWFPEGRARSPYTGERGFSLVEVLVSTLILTSSLVAIAQLFGIATSANMSAKATTSAALLAEAKMEELRGLTWGFDDLGLPFSDTTTNLSVQPADATGTGLLPSPGNTLAGNTVGFVDHLDENGVWAGNDQDPPARAVYTRRWSIEPLPTNPNNTLILQVLVTRERNRDAADAIEGVSRMRDDARLVSVKTRKSR